MPLSVRRWRFVLGHQVCSKVNLNNILIFKNHVEEFDMVTSRAVSDLRILTELSLPALKVKGLFIPLKGTLDSELENSKDTIELLKGKILEKKEFVLPIL